MARRKTEVFGLSFLDCICCGFGATILIYMVLNSGASKRADKELGPLKAETDRLEQQVLEGQNFVGVSGAPTPAQAPGPGPSAAAGSAGASAAAPGFKL